MKNLAVLTALALLALCPMALAEPFEHSPEFFAPQWETSFPYQRNIDWTFATDPLGGPSPDGAPGADYEGYDDLLLRDSDYVLYCHGFQWHESLPDAPGSGVLAIDNRQGNEAVMGSVAFHIDNWEFPRSVKNIWIEADYAPEPDSETVDIDMGWILPSGTAVVDFGGDEESRELPNGLLRRNFWYQIMPNPIWETLCLEVNVQPGSYFLVDRLHVATECVPEPSMVALLGIGFGAVVLMLVRRRR